MFSKRTTLGAAAALALSASAAWAAPAVTETDLNMRTGPGTGYAVITAIPGGATVDVVGCSGGWCEVAFAGNVGYSSRSYLAMADRVTTRTTVVRPPTVYVPRSTYSVFPRYGYGYDYYRGPSIGFRFGVDNDRRGWRGNQRAFRRELRGDRRQDRRETRQEVRQDRREARREARTERRDRRD